MILETKVRPKLYLCIVNAAYNKSSIQRQILNKDISTIDNHSGLLRNRALSTHFVFYLSKCECPIWLPCNTRPYFHLLPIEHLTYRIIYLNTSLVKAQKKLKKQNKVNNKAISQIKNSTSQSGSELSSHFTGMLYSPTRQVI